MARKHKPATQKERWSLVRRRERALGRFLNWAAQCEKSKATSRRFERRSDLPRVRQVLDLFGEPWWGLVVYSCFDSVIGTKAVASSFQRPVEPARATHLLDHTSFPTGSVGHHRRRPAVAGAKRALISACTHSSDFRRWLLGRDSFDDRYRALRELRMPQWGRTTCFDLLTRAVVLGVPEESYLPLMAYLRGSTGPRRGFKSVWGLDVGAANAADCEALLNWWTENWDTVARHVGAKWVGKPLDSADLENYLCVFGHGRPSDRAENSKAAGPC